MPDLIYNLFWIVTISGSVFLSLVILDVCRVRIWRKR